MSYSVEDFWALVGAELYLPENWFEAGHAKLLLLGVLGFMGVVSLWTPLAFPPIRERWLSLPNILFLWPIPVITLLTAYLAWRWLESGREVPPFLAAILLFMLGYNRFW